MNGHDYTTLTVEVYDSHPVANPRAKRTTFTVCAAEADKFGIAGCFSSCRWFEIFNERGESVFCSFTGSASGERRRGFPHRHTPKGHSQQRRSKHERIHL